ncbi:MAG: glucoamylase family protein [Gemmatirosa sp.]
MRSALTRAAAVATAVVLGGCAGAPAPAVAPARYVPTAGQQAFLDTLGRRTFDWFWETTNPRNGLTPDRWPTKSFSSVAAIGFALSAYPVGVERGWVTREQARERVLTTLRFLWRLPQGPQPTGVAGHRGFFYHFLDMETGLRFERVELSTIDTALLLAGVLTCREYFDRAEPADTEVRALADSLYLRVDWDWARAGRPLVSMGWHPEPWLPDHDANNFIVSNWRGYMEAMLLYALALGSPTHPVPDGSWAEWVKTYQWDTFHGQTFVQFAPLFGHQYSHVWIDFRGIQDAYMRGRGIDYHENSRRATLSQQAYAIANPGGWRDYSDRVWGLTASDGPLDSTFTLDGRARTFHSYWARGAGRDEINDDGTIAPTAAGGAIAFVPEIVVPSLVAMRQRYGDDLFGRYGFRDAFNPTLRAPGPRLQHGRIVAGKGWFDGDHLGIDQGPILLMLENQRSELVWRLMRRNPYVVRGLCRAGFSGGWLDGQC